MSDGNGLGEITPLGVDNGSIDNCSIDNYSLDIDTFGCDDIGANTVILTVTDVNGNSTTCTAIVTVTEFLSTESVLTTENVKIYPNPTEESLIISFPRELEVSIHLIDLVGKLIQSQNNVIVSKTHSMNISYLNTGTYFVRIKSEIGIVTKRIIKE